MEKISAKKADKIFDVTFNRLVNEGIPYYKAHALAKKEWIELTQWEYPVKFHNLDLKQISK